MSLASLAWRCGATLAAPVLPLWLRLRCRRGKELAGRLAERRGCGIARPSGPLLWLHAASIGETLSLLPVLDALARRAPALSILLTTGTVTSAALLERRLPPALRPRVIHRFVPLDVPSWVGRFLDGWRPDAAGMVESELWPNLLRAAHARRLPLALINGRLSARSAARWRLAPALGRELMAAFTLILAQSPADAARFAALGARAVSAPGNLKEAAPPLPADPAALATLQAAIGHRPVLLGAQTHPGEEAMLIEAHRQLAGEFPGLLTILAPRHPERGAAIVAEAGGLSACRRSTGALPGPGTELYIADTLGELGILYRLAGVALVGGSLVPHGGQNPLEPARLGCPILLGPHTANFADIVARLLAAGAARLVRPAEAAALAAAIRAVLSNPDHGRNLADAAAVAIASADALPDEVAEALLRLLPASALGDEDRSTPDAH